MSQYIDTYTGPIYSPPADLPNGDYHVEALFNNVFEEGTTMAHRSAKLYVCPIVLEPITNETDVNGYNYNPASIVVGESGWFKIEVGDLSHIPEADIVWSGEGVRFGQNGNTGRIVEVIPMTTGTKILTVVIKNQYGNRTTTYELLHHTDIPRVSVRGITTSDYQTFSVEAASVGSVFLNRNPSTLGGP